MRSSLPDPERERRSRVPLCSLTPCHPSVVCSSFDRLLSSLGVHFALDFEHNGTCSSGRAEACSTEVREEGGDGADEGGEQGRQVIFAVTHEVADGRYEGEEEGRGESGGGEAGNRRVRRGRRLEHASNESEDTADVLTRQEHRLITIK